MEVILLERVAKLGQMGEVVRVKDGFARNFLLKRGKALRATADNRARFDGMKAELEARNLKAKAEATKRGKDIPTRQEDQTRPPKRSPPPANSSIPRPAARMSSRRRSQHQTSNAGYRLHIIVLLQPGLVRPGLVILAGAFRRALQ